MSSVDPDGNNPDPKGPPQGKKVQPQGIQLLPLLTKYFMNVGFMLGVWGVGYFQFSCSWVMLGTFLFMMSKYYRKIKNTRKAYALQAVQNEREAILARTEELPSWVFFPDVERAEWLNKMIQQLWPYIGEYAKSILRNSVEPTVNNSLPGSLKPFKFETINLGSIPPRIGGVKVYTTNIRRDEIIMDMEIFYASDSVIKVAVRGFNAGIKDLQIHGTIRVVMTPLVSVMPLIGGMNVFFLNSPTVEFDLTDVANILDFPLLSDTLRTVLEDQIAYYMVLPNKIPLKLVDGVDMSRLKYPQPQGVLRIQVVAARELKAADIKVFGKGKSDPYCKIYIGAHIFKTKVIKDTVNPVWNEFFEAVVEQKHGQFAEIDVLDEDPGEDDELGSASVDIQNVAAEGKLDTWLPLEGVKTGMVHVRAMWLHLSKDPTEIDREGDRRDSRVKARWHGESTRSSQLVPKKAVEQANQERAKFQTEDHLSSSLLLVHLDSAHNLPRIKKSMKEPSPMVKFVVGNVTKKSVPQQRTVDPTWEENFEFLIHDASQQDLLIQVMNSDNEKKIGVLEYPLKNLLKAQDMTVNRPFQLQQSEASATITLRLSLRVLTSVKPPVWATDEPVGLSEDIRDSSVDPPQPAAADEPSTPDTTHPEEPEQAAPVAPSTPEPETINTTTPGEVSRDRESPDKVQATDETKTEAQPVQNGTGSAGTATDKPETTLRQRKLPSTGSDTDNNLGRVQLTIRYSVQRNRLVVVVHSCQGLLACDDNQLSDPYVRMYLLPDRSSSSKRKTGVVKDNLNPVYDEQFDWNLTLSEVSRCTLDLMVKNQVGFLSKNRTKMGQIYLELSKLDLTKPTTDWYYLQDPEELARQRGGDSD